MRILLINHYAGTPTHGMEYRPFYLAREWSKAGHDVTIAAASFSHVRITQPVFSGKMSEEEINGIRYMWMKTPEYSGNGAGRAFNIAAFVSRLLSAAPKIAWKIAPDAVIASSTYPLDIVPARRIARLSRAKLIYEVHDLWPLSPIVLGGMSRFHPFIMVMQWAENRAYQWSDRVVSLLPLAKDHMMEHGMAGEKFAYVPNGILAEDWESVATALPEEHERTLSDLKSRGKFLVCYAGAHGLANSLESFIGAANLLKDEAVQLVLVGDGPEKRRLVELACRLKQTEKVSFLPSVPKTVMPEILGRMDALFISLQKCGLFKYGISPNKLLDYMMAGKPVINAVEAGNDPVSEAGCGISVPAEDPSAIARAVSVLMRLGDAERAEMGLRGREYVIRRHDYKRLAEEFLGVLSG